MTKVADVVVGPDGKSHYIPNYRIEAIAVRPEHQGSPRFRNQDDGWGTRWRFGKYRYTGNQRAEAKANRPILEQWRRNAKARDLKYQRHQRQMAAKRPKTKWNTVRGYGGKALNGLSGASSLILPIYLISQLFRKDEAGRIAAEAEKLNFYKQIAEEKYNRAMYPSLYKPN